MNINEELPKQTLTMDDVHRAVDIFRRAKAKTNPMGPTLILPVSLIEKWVPLPDPETGLVPCDYCNETHEQKPLFHENNYEPHTCMMSTISIEGNNGKHQIEIDLWDGGNVYAAFEINYCPMCGRKLGVEG